MKAGIGSAEGMKKPLLIATIAFPPRVSGSAILNRNLWSAWPADDLVVIANQLPGVPVDPTMALPHVATHWIERWPFRPPWEAYLEPLATPLITRRICEVAHRVTPRAIWASWPTTPYLLGAWRAARKLRLPLYVHLHDMWRQAYADKPGLIFERLIVLALERAVLSSARRLFTITEEAAEHFRSRLGLDSYVLPHAIPASDLAAMPATLGSAGNGVIHFAGAIYGAMNLDALQNVAQAMPLCKRAQRLDCFTARNIDVLRQMGITGPKVSVRFTSKTEVMAAQREASIMVLPLAFKSSNPLEIRTVFPTKLLEYLVCGRPILVHAPADSWASRHARSEGWGEVVDEPDPRKLALALDALLTNSERQAQLVSAAFTEARRRNATDVAGGLRAELHRLEQAGQRTG